MDARRIVRVDLAALSEREAREILATHEKLLGREVRRYLLRARTASWVGYEDLVAIAQVAALEASQTYSEDKAARMSLPGWIRRIVGHRLGDAVRAAIESGGYIRVVALTKDTDAAGRTKAWAAVLLRHVSLDDNAVRGQGQEDLTFHEIVPDDTAVDSEEYVVARDAMEKVRSAIGQLSVRHSQILGSEMAGVHNAEVGRELGVSRQKVSRDRRAALQRVRETLGVDDPGAATG